MVNVKPLKLGTTERMSFSRIEEVLQMPNLIEVQKSSYENFLQRTTPAAKRTQSGLQEVYRGVFPIKVNPQSHVMRDVMTHGRAHHVGLEAGSKPELMAVLAMQVRRCG